MQTFKVLLLEDDLKTVSKIFSLFSSLEEKYNRDISVMVLSEYTQAEYLNNSDMVFHLILLDRDCKATGSFHVLDLDRFGIDKVISISSMPEWNIEAQARGVTKVVHKTYSDLDDFIKKLELQIEQFLKHKIVSI